MGRPVQPIGTYGKISITTVKGGYMAQARLRGFSGGYQRVSATAPTRNAATNELKVRIQQVFATQQGGDISPHTALRDVATLWLEEVRLEERVKPQSLQRYERAVKSRLVPDIGDVRLRELTVGFVDRYLKRLFTDETPTAARDAKLVLSPILALAVRHDAIATNPVRETRGIPKPKRQVRIVDDKEREAIRNALRPAADAPKKLGPRPERFLAQVFDTILGTSARIGEVLAIRAVDVDLDADGGPEITISGTLVQIDGVGLIRQDHPKHSRDWRVVKLPAFAADSIRERLDDAGPLAPEQTVFCARGGGLRAPSNVRRAWRSLRADAGLPGGLDLEDITPHSFRRTAATEVEAQADINLAAELLGHASTDVTATHYVRRRVRVDPATAGILERLGPTDPAAK